MYRKARSITKLYEHWQVVAGVEQKHDRHGSEGNTERRFGCLLLRAREEDGTGFLPLLPECRGSAGESP